VSSPRGRGWPRPIGARGWLAMCLAAWSPAIATAAGPDAVGGVTVVGIVLGTPRGPVAVIDDPRTRRASSYRVGDTVGGATVVDILRDRVVVQSAGARVELRLAASRAAGGSPGLGPGALRRPGVPVPQGAARFPWRPRRPPGR
jgi:hypothetical protein